MEELSDHWHEDVEAHEKSNNFLQGNIVERPPRLVTESNSTLMYDPSFEKIICVISGTGGGVFILITWKL